MSEAKPEAPAAFDGLKPGGRILIIYGSTGEEAEVIAVGNDRVAVKLVRGEVEIMDTAELERRNYIVLPTRVAAVQTQSWWQRLLGVKL